MYTCNAYVNHTCNENVSFYDRNTLTRTVLHMKQQAQTQTHSACAQFAPASNANLTSQ